MKIIDIQKEFNKNNTSLSIQIFDNFDSLSHIKDQWNKLVYNSLFPNIFLTWEWLSIWWRWFSEKKYLHLILIFKANYPMSFAFYFENTSYFKISAL